MVTSDGQSIAALDGCITLLPVMLSSVRIFVLGFSVG